MTLFLSVFFGYFNKHFSFAFKFRDPTLNMIEPALDMEKAIQAYISLRVGHKHGRK